jgi:hypothetical protein
VVSPAAASVADTVLVNVNEFTPKLASGIDTVNFPQSGARSATGGRNLLRMGTPGAIIALINARQGRCAEEGDDGCERCDADSSGFGVSR